MTRQTTTKKTRATRKTTKAKTSNKAKSPGAKAKATSAQKSRDAKLTALDAAAQVLAQSTEPMTTKQLIETMAAKKLWTSPGGKTPERTLYAALLREINAQGKQSRFKRLGRGKFVAGG